MLDLASHIVKTKAGHFDTDKFEDQYEDALKELLKKKQEGKPIERPERPKPTNVVNLMDALRQSVEVAATSTKAKARAASSRSSSEKAEHPKPKRTRRSG
jgi:DNA end-binding protein Ku